MRQPTTFIGRTIVIAGLLATAAVAGPATSLTTQATPGVDVVIAHITSGPTVISGKMKNQSAATVFNKLGELAAVRFAFPQDPSFWDDPQLRDASFSVDWDRDLFWECAAETCESAGVHIAAGDGRLASTCVHVDRGTLAQPMSFHGPTLIRAMDLTRSSSVYFWKHEPSDERISLTLQLFLEPKLGQAAWVMPPVVDSAADDRGHTMAGGTSFDEPRGMMYNPSALHHALFAYPKNPGTHIAGIKGKMPLLAAKDMGQFTFHDPLHHQGPMSVTVGRNKLTLKSVTGDAKNGYRCDLTLTRGKDETPDRWGATAGPLGTFGAFVAMIAPKGTTLHSGGSGNWSDQELNCQLDFPGQENAEEATNLRIDLPIDFAPLTATFEFKNLPMP